MASDTGSPWAGQMAEFSPRGLLRNPHFQSFVTQAPWRRRLARRQARQLLERASPVVLDCGDGVRLEGHLSVAPERPRGIAVLLHGWEGSAESSYVLTAGAALFAAGFSVLRLNFRDHGDTQSLNEGLFHSCRIDEVVGAVARIRERHPSGRFALIGQSLGGNFALRVAARADDAALDLDRVIAVCPVLRPHSTMRALDEGLWIYQRYFLARWRRSLSRKAAAFPALYDFGDLRRFPTLTATTKFFVEQYTEFASLDEYLTGYAVTGSALESIQVPTKIVLAADDPVIPVEDLAAIARPAALDVTLLERGGHCGFVDRLAGPSWIDRAIAADLGATV